MSTKRIKGYREKKRLADRKIKTIKRHKRKSRNE
jgi:hypothetical protein